MARQQLLRVFARVFQPENKDRSLRGPRFSQVKVGRVLVTLGATDQIAFRSGPESKLARSGLMVGKHVSNEVVIDELAVTHPELGQFGVSLSGLVNKCIGDLALIDNTNRFSAMA